LLKGAKCLQMRQLFFVVVVVVVIDRSTSRFSCGRAVPHHIDYDDDYDNDSDPDSDPCSAFDLDDPAASV